MTTPKQHLLQKTSVVWICALICTALWGSAFPCIKTGYVLFQIPSSDTSSQILFAGLRFFLAGLLTILIGSIGQRRFLIPKPSSGPKVFVLSMFQTVIQYLLFYIGLAHTTGVKGSILGGTSVLFSILIACLIFRQETFSSSKLAGCLIGFAGIVIVNLNGAGMELGFTFTGEGFMILSALSYALSSIFFKRFSSDDDPVTLSGYQFLLGGLIMIIIGGASGGRISILGVSSILLLIYMALISAVAYSLWGMLLKYNPVSKITVFGFMTQVFGVLLSALILKEQGGFGPRTLLALILVCMGIYLVNKSKKTPSCG
ncbi:carboxylate/amino acid/amine transporter [uncultured Roseburia sp.]|uniref:DMT family transporter n=1 Tax=Brotonthovivens ammoniilytica TaxID=2981725 RepID=A0ABT2TI22_9FIRM|nr:DMT family transporter [Brotonthovivens ammoniilytica]MCU6761516.1 DMT family transporter [Brotonthovivens ammoniilytica]SCI30706.1 carboxylate/amino acid/amine transporter [uncultured Roseburia sp.]